MAVGDLAAEHMGDLHQRIVQKQIGVGSGRTPAFGHLPTVGHSFDKWELAGLILVALAALSSICRRGAARR